MQQQANGDVTTTETSDVKTAPAPQATVSGLLQAFRPDLKVTADTVLAMVRHDPGLLLDSGGTLAALARRLMTRLRRCGAWHAQLEALLERSPANLARALSFETHRCGGPCAKNASCTCSMFLHFIRFLFYVVPDATRAFGGGCCEAQCRRVTWPGVSNSDGGIALLLAFQWNVMFLTKPACWHRDPHSWLRSLEVGHNCSHHRVACIPSR